MNVRGRRTFLVAIVGGVAAAAARVLPVSAAPPQDFPDGITLGPTVRLFTPQATVAQVDDGAGGQGQLRVTGSLYAHLAQYANGTEPSFKVDRQTKVTTIGSLISGYRTTLLGRFLHNGQTLTFQGPKATATSDLVQTQALFLFQPSRWDGTQSKDVNGNISLRATADGNAFWIFELPRREVMYLRESGLEINKHVFLDEPAAKLSGGNDGAVRFGDDTGVQRAGPKTLAVLGDALKLPASLVLPTPSAAGRGQVRRVEGGVGSADGLFLCEKQADETYAWRAL